MKKILAMILCVVMVMSLASVTFAAEEKYIDLTPTSLGIAGAGYADGEVAVDGVNFGYTEIGDYGNGIQMRTKNEKSSAIWNTVAIPGNITKIVLTYNADKKTYDNPDCFSFTFGSAADALNAEVKLSTVADQKEYTVTAPEGEYTFFKMLHTYNYSFYWDSIKVYYEEPAAGGETGNDTVVPEPPVSEEKTALISAPVEYSAAWDFEAVKILTTVWGGTVDPSIISEGGKLVVTYTGTENGIALALNNGSWFQFDTPAANAADGEGWVATYTYEDLVAKCGSADFSTLGAIQIAASNLPVTVTGVYWVVESNDNTGDMIGVVVALLAVSGLGITVLKKKEF